MEFPPGDEICTVCHERFDFPCQANCGHWFCGSCILRWWRHGSAFQPCRCPICRRSITLLIPANGIQNQQEAINIEIENYNRQFGGQHVSLTQRFRDLPFFIRRLAREMMDPGRTLPLVFRARMMLAMFVTAIYVLSPVDILPEGALGLVGYIDDFFVLLIVVLHIAAIYRQLLFFRHGGQ